MEFVARLEDQVSAPAGTATAAMVAFRDATLAAHEALTKFSGAGAPAATAAGAVTTPAKAATEATDRFGAAMDRMKGRVTTAVSAVRNLSVVQKVGELWDGFKQKAGAAVDAAKDKVVALGEKALAPVRKAFGFAAEKAGALWTKVKDSSAGRFLADAGIIAGGVLGKGFTAAREKAGTLWERVKDSKAFTMLQAGAGKALGALSYGLEKANTLAKVAAGAVLGLAAGVLSLGARSAGGLDRLVLGNAGAARLQSVLAKAGVGVRSLFSQVNAGPIVGSIERLLQNFNATSVTGKQISNIIGRWSQLIAPAIEAVDVLITYLVLEATLAEIAVLKIQIAWNNVRAAVSSVLDPLSSVVGLIGQGASKIGGLLGFSASSGTGAGNTELDTKAPRGAAAAASTTAASAAPAADAVQAPAKAAGEAIGDGMVQGMNSKAGEVQAAGAALAKAADTGVKTAAQIKSPARLFRLSGAFMGKGVALGMEDEAPNVQRAAEKSLVPDPKGLNAPAPQGGTPTASSASVSLVIQQLIVQATGGGAADLAAAIKVELFKQIEGVAITLGVPTEVP